MNQLTNPVARQLALAEITLEHAQIAVHLDNLATLLLDKAHHDVVVAEVRALAHEVGVHFGFEESVMQEHDYVHYEQHRRQHIGLMTELAQLLDKTVSVFDLSKTARTIDFITHWYRQHVAHSDRELEVWLEAGKPD